MAGNNLNQIVLDAFRQANGNTGAGSDVQALVRDELQGRLDLRSEGGTRAEVVFPA